MSIVVLRLARPVQSNVLVRPGLDLSQERFYADSLATEAGHQR